MAAPKLLDVYLNDHLAGSVAGMALARRIVRQNSGNEYGGRTAKIVAEIEEDQRELRKIMERLGIREKKLRLGVAWLVEKFTRLKPNGRIVGYSPLSRVIELEGLVMGITGKLELWRSLDQIEDTNPALDETHIRALIDRAESQRDQVEDLRVKAADEALREQRAS
jgi:hypothetical protein